MSLTSVPTSMLDAGSHNPRSEVDTAGDAFQELVASISTHGVLQPILVGSPVDGRWPIIAGHRRAAAAAVAGLKEIPAMEVTHLDGWEVAAALTENIMREDLTPVEEALAMQALAKAEKLASQKTIATRIGKSASWVSARLSLLELPAVARDAVHEGTMPMEAVGPIRDLARSEPEIAKSVAEVVLSGSSGINPRQLVESGPNRAISAIARSDEGPYLLGIWQSYIDKSSVPDRDRLAELKAAVDAIDAPQWKKNVLLSDVEDIDAASAYGCLLSIPSTHGTGDADRWYTDPEWVADRLALKIEHLAADVARHNKAREEAIESGEVPDHDAERKAREEETEARERERSHAVAELDSRAMSQWPRVELADLTIDDVRVLVLFAADINDREQFLLNDEFEGFVETVLDENDAGKLMALLLRTLASGYFGNAYNYRHEPIDPSAPFSFSVRDELSDKLAALLDRWGLESKVLPQSMIDSANGRAREREERAVERAKADEDGASDE